MFYIIFFTILSKLKLDFLIIYFIKKKIIKDNNSRAKKKYNLLMLSFEKFRGDLTILGKRNDLQIYKISNLWLSRLYRVFYGVYIKRTQITPKKLFNNETCPTLKKKQKKYHHFLKILLKELKISFQFDCIISADIKYISDIDLGLVSEKIGLPYIVFHRENLFACKSIYDLVLKRWSKWKEFKGSKIIVHNNVTKKLFLESGFVSEKNEKKIEVGGCLRMDYLIKKSKEIKRKKENSIVFFSFGKQSYNSNWPNSIFKTAHEEIVKFAKNNPTTKVYIKPKSRVFLKNNLWKDAFYRSTNKISNDLSEIKNLVISPYLDSTKLILDSNFVVALNSTVILEASIIGKPVIIPYFQGLRNKKHRDSIYFFSFLDCFDTPKNSKEFYENMTFRLKNSQIKRHITNKRKKLYNKYLHSHTDNISNNYFKIIKSVVNET